MRWQVTSIGFDIPLEDDDDVLQNMQDNASLVRQYINTEWSGDQLDAVQAIQKDSGHLVSTVIFKAVQ